METPTHEKLIECIVDNVTHDNVDALLHRLDMLTMPTRVRKYLWSQLLAAQQPEDRSHYFRGYIVIYGLTMPR